MKNGLEHTFKLSGQEKKNKLLHLKKKNLLILTVGRLFFVVVTYIT